MSTATTHSSRVDPRVVTLLVVGLYLSTIAVPRIIGSGGAVRQKLIVEALLFGAVLGGLGVIQSVRGRLRFDRAYVGILTTFVEFILLSTLALIIGFIRGYPTGDLLGDYYKFVVPVATVLLIYAATDSSRQLETAFAITFRIALLLFIILFVLYFSGALSQNQRPGFVYHYPLVLVIGYWLFQRGEPFATYGFPFLLAALFPFVFYTQSLSLLLQIVITAGLAAVYFWTDDVTDFIIGAGVLVIVGLSTAGMFVYLASRISVAQWEQYGYLGSKVVALVGDYTLFERMVLLGGSRAAEPFGVLARIDDNVFELLFGAGMGSTFVVSSPFGSSVWAGEDHFVHAGLWEAVLRTGLLGGMAYIGLLLSYLYVGWQVSDDSYLGALAAANASVVLLFAPVTGKLLGPQFFSYALFAYALVRWTELRT